MHRQQSHMTESHTASHTLMVHHFLLVGKRRHADERITGKKERVVWRAETTLVNQCDKWTDGLTTAAVIVKAALIPVIVMSKRRISHEEPLRHFYNNRLNRKQSSRCWLSQCFSTAQTIIPDIAPLWAARPGGHKNATYDSNSLSAMRSPMKNKQRPVIWLKHSCTARRKAACPTLHTSKPLLIDWKDSAFPHQTGSSVFLDYEPDRISRRDIGGWERSHNVFARFFWNLTTIFIFIADQSVKHTDQSSLTVRK